MCFLKNFMYTLKLCFICRDLRDWSIIGLITGLIVVMTTLDGHCSRF